MSQSEKIKGIVLLGLVKTNDLLMRLIFYKCSGYEVWTLNDFWIPYPGLKPDRAYQLHKDIIPHVDEFNNKRDCSNYLEECQERNVKTIIHDLSINDYMRYYGQQPEEWYQSSINYMFVDAWHEIEAGRSEPNIIIEGMPFTGSGERDRQLPFVKSAVTMSVNRGITVQVSTLEEWESNTNAISWKDIKPGVVTYALTQQDYGVYQERVSNKIKEASRKIINMNLARMYRAKNTRCRWTKGADH